MSKTTTLLTPKQLAILENSETTGKLTRKQAAFVRHLLENPKASATAAVLATYGKPGKPTTYGTAGDIASTNMKKPQVLAILNDAATEAETVISRVMRRAERFSATNDRNGPAWASVARGAANDILDRVHGKATTRVEAISAVVTVNMDLTGQI